MKKASANPDGSHKYTPASSSNLFLDRKGNENEYEPAFLEKLSDYYKKMGMINERALPLRKDVYGGIESAIATSDFYLLDNEYTDFDSGFEKTEAAKALETSLGDYFQKSKIPVELVVISLDEMSSPKLQNAENPNRFVVAAQADLDEAGNGLIYLMAVTAEEDFDATAIDPTVVARKAANTIRHELMHDRQYANTAADMGITKREVKKKFEDWGLIPPAGAPREDYLSSHIEIDAYGHEFAEELAQKFGLDEAQRLVASADVEEMRRLAEQMKDEMSENFVEYYGEFGDASFTKKLQKKIRKYLRLFQREKVYEGKVVERVMYKLLENA